MRNPSMQGRDSKGLTLDRFLVAYDFSAASEKALRFAVSLAKQHDVTIRIVHASRAMSSIKDAEPFRGVAAYVNDEDARKLEIIAERCRLQVPNVEYFQIPGDPNQVLRQQIAGWNPDLCFLGAYGDGPSGRDAIGSTASALLRSLPCVVVMFGPKADLRHADGDTPEQIVCPIDFPEDVQARLGIIASLASRLHAAVDLVHVVDLSNEVSRPHNATGVQYDFDLLVAELFLKRVTATSALLYGNPESRIAEHAIEKAATCILFGRHKAGKCSSHFEGDLVEKVIKNAPCAVMVFPQHVESKSGVATADRNVWLTPSPARSYETEKVDVGSHYSGLPGGTRRGVGWAFDRR